VPAAARRSISEDSMPVSRSFVIALGAAIVSLASPARADDAGVTGAPAGAPSSVPASAAGPRAPLGRPPRVAGAARLEGAIAIDGALDEAGWAAAPALGGFVQRAPVEGAPPRYATEFRVLYGDDSIYVGVRAFDPAAAEIRGFLARRDRSTASDWIVVGLDSYHDRRTAFVFALNPAGVQRDFLIFDDATEDASWDAVWQGASRIDRDGWTAEFSIPYGQLRFSAAPEQIWGLQVVREISRLGEVDVWSPWGKSEPRVVSRFGEVRGLAGILAPRRLELLPYVVAGGAFYRPDDGDPLNHGHDPILRAGGDFKLGLGSSFTVAGTVNPDFGQVEADPSQVNLGASELFFPEKRPFFLEGSDIFRFAVAPGEGNVEQLLYSRRIGAAPHVDGADYGEHVRQPDATTIYGAAKLSGKTSNGWSFGLLEAVTSEEIARVESPGAGPIDEIVIEPLASYAIARVRKDLREGKTMLGGALTAVHRDLDDRPSVAWLHDRAYTGGLELTHRFGGDRFSADAKLMGSWVHGSPEALLETQTSSVHWFQRPDNDHVDFDPTRTSLGGAAANASIGKIAGDLRGAVGVEGRTPGFELNDLGFQRGSDFVSSWAWLQRRDDNPGGALRDWGGNLNGWTNWDAGGTFTSAGGNFNGWINFANQWGVNGGVGVSHDVLDPGALRGGPMLRRDDSFVGWAGVFSDGRRALRASLSGNGYLAPASDSGGGGVDAALTWQVASNAEVSFGPSVYGSVDDNQYVDEAQDGDGDPRYVMARIHQVTTGLTLRADYTVSPTLSMQLYAQPFVATGRYDEFKEVVAPRADAYADRYHVFDGAELAREPGGVLGFDRGGDGVDFRLDDPDFNFRQLRSNLVVRWEYRPGSTLFAIWSHGRTSEAAGGSYALGRELAGLGREPGEHLVMAKLSCWFGL
jgi:hypothetical protein